MEGNEQELKLSDLKFDDNGMFDVFKQKGGATTQAPDINNPADVKETTNSEGEIKNPESVAKSTNDQGKDGKTDTSSNSSSPQQQANDKLFAALAANFKSKGVLPNLDLEKNPIKSLDDFTKAMTAEVFERLDEKQKAASKALELGLDPKTMTSQLETINKLKSISSEFITKEGNDPWRKDAIKQDLINKGINEERADVMAQRSIDSGNGNEDATLALAAIIKEQEESYNSKIQKAQDKETKTADDIKAYINKDEEILPGVKLNSQQIEEIYSKITTDLGNKENAFIQAQKQDPIGSRIKLETLFHLTKGLTDFSIFSKSDVKKANSSFEELLRGSNFADQGSGASSFAKGDDENFTLADLKGMKFE